MRYRQTIIAYIVKYVIYKWLVAAMTIGIVAIYDFYKYKRAAIILNDKSLTHEFGVFTKNSREVGYKNIQSVTLDQSVIGQMFNYGHIIITTANQTDSIIFKYVARPQLLRAAIQDRVV